MARALRCASLGAGQPQPRLSRTFRRQAGGFVGHGGAFQRGAGNGRLRGDRHRQAPPGLFVNARTGSTRRPKRNDGCLDACWRGRAGPDAKAADRHPDSTVDCRSRPVVAPCTWRSMPGRSARCGPCSRRSRPRRGCPFQVWPRTGSTHLERQSERTSCGRSDAVTPRSCGRRRCSSRPARLEARQVPRSHFAIPTQPTECC